MFKVEQGQVIAHILVVIKCQYKIKGTLTQLSNKVREYCKQNGINNVNFTKDVILQNDGDGAYIKEWNLDINKPTDSQLTALENECDKIERNIETNQKRILEYGTWKEQLDDIYHNGIDGWKEKIKAVNDKYPKE